MFGPVRVGFLCVGGIEVLLDLFVNKILIKLNNSNAETGLDRVVLL